VTVRSTIPQRPLQVVRLPRRLLIQRRGDRETQDVDLGRLSAIEKAARAN